MRTHFGVLMVVTGIVIAACGYGPTRIAQAQPVEVAPPAQRVALAPPPPGLRVVREGHMFLESADLEATVAEAVEIVLNHGGYHEATGSWTEESGRFTRLVLYVPLARAESVQSSIGGLGIHYRASDWLPLTDPGARLSEWDAFVSLTVTLYQVGAAAPPPVPPAIPVPIEPQPVPDSRPLRTLDSALDVTQAIFLFLLDIAIWLGVVVAPFVVLGVVGRWLYRRYWPWGIVERPVRRLEERDER